MKIKHPNSGAHNWLIYKNIMDYLIKFSPHIKGVVYDFGCGERAYEQFILEYAEKYVGIDWGNTLHSLKADIISNLNEPLSIESNSVDTIISISVLEHLFEPQVMLNESYRILKKGGYLILQVPFQWWVHEAPYDYFRYTPYALEKMFQIAGFTDIQIFPIGGYFFTKALKTNYFWKRFLYIKKPINYIFILFIYPMFYINQWLAPILDKLDRNKLLEAPGYWIIGKR